MKETNKYSSWSFELDRVYFYAFYKNAFSKEECKEIIKIGKNKNLKKGEVIGIERGRSVGRGVFEQASSGRFQICIRQYCDAFGEGVSRES